MLKIYTNIKLRFLFSICTKATWACLYETYCNQWKIESLNKPKLSTYVKFKTCFKIEDYVYHL